jgi:adenylate cyclase
MATARNRPKILETRYFGFVIAALIIALMALLTYSTGIMESFELRLQDSYFRWKTLAQSKALQVGSLYSEKNIKISDDLLIVGIDEDTLQKFGRWPFPRSRHADLINVFSRIKDQGQRESSFLLDIFFFENADDKANDQALSDAMKQSGKVYVESEFGLAATDVSSTDEMRARQDLLVQRFGSIRNVKGDWQDMISFQSEEAPLAAFTDMAKGYGHATFIPDHDNIFRKQPLIAKFARPVETVRLDSIQAGYKVDESSYERLAWMDRDGFYHNVPSPVTAAVLAELKEDMLKRAPRKVDESGDSQGYFILTKFRDSFIPSITLSLALDYFGKTYEDLDVKIGDRIRIPAPTRLDTDSGNRVPYVIQLKPDQFDAQGNLVKEGKKRSVPYIDIPIDANGMMLINFMGPPSSASPEGLQTYPVRSYAGYSEKAPPADPAKWRRTMAVANKIILVGPFAHGMSDEKQTPEGIMFGIELHANALNTILMDNFLRSAPVWMNMLVLVGLALLVALMASRGQTIFSFFGTLVLLIVYFLATNIVFELKSFLFNYSTPAVAMIFTFIAIVVYRAMTEERDKRRIRETFGKYVSPKVVEQLAENPPELGGIDRELTVFFSDIRDFTKISETMPPQELINFLNVYMTAMTEILLDYGGTLDKYVGDELMGFWGAPMPQPDHALLACKCALVQMSRLGELNKTLSEARQIKIGIGINTGTMTVGNMGSPVRMNYTLAGDNVNLGSRLEGINKAYGTRIIISEYTYALVKDKVVARELDNIRVKGKNKPVVIYELIDVLEGLEPPPLDAGLKKKKKRGGE